MTALESLLLAYWLNAAWQLPLWSAAGWLLLRALREPSPRLEYGVWFATVCLGATVPLSVVGGLFRPSALGPAAAIGLPDSVWRLLLLAILMPAGWTAVRLCRAMVATARLRRAAPPLFWREGVEVRELPEEWAAARPVLTGVFRPVILIPAFLREPAQVPLLEAALAHELAHVRRRDLFTHLVAEVLLTPLAVHPLHSWLRGKLHASRELACDAEAGLEPMEYARCLFAIARQALQPRPPLCTALGIGDAGILERRIRALAVPATRVLTRRERRLALGLLVLAVALLMMAAQRQYQWLTSVPAPGTRVTPPPPPAPARRPA